MLKSHAQSIAGSLTRTSKMPCASYSLPTSECRTGSKLAKVAGTICASCYANKGFYKVYAKTIQKAQHARFDSIDNPELVQAMITLIGKAEFFRWHDSGDIRDIVHLQKIVEVAQALPGCRFWLPTRERSVIRSYLKFFGSLPDNLIVRLSAVKFDTVSETIAGLPTATAHKDGKPIGFECKATKQNGECRNCRACWNSSIKNISYLSH